MASGEDRRKMGVHSHNAAQEACRQWHRSLGGDSRSAAPASEIGSASVATDLVDEVLQT
jgi:hypothetical protein